MKIYEYLKILSEYWVSGGISSVIFQNLATHFIRDQCFYHCSIRERWVARFWIITLHLPHALAKFPKFSSGQFCFSQKSAGRQLKRQSTYSLLEYNGFHVTKPSLSTRWNNFYSKIGISLELELPFKQFNVKLIQPPSQNEFHRKFF